MGDTRRTRNNFLITGFGRSGTKFLATALNGSPTWTVGHEPAGSRESLPRAIARFDRDEYGEVNSRLRQFLPLVPAGRKAIILRDPQEIAVSVFNRHTSATPARLEGVWELLDAYVSESYLVFRFEEFTSDVDALRFIARWAGIMDLRLAANVVNRPINASEKKIVTCYGDLPREIRKQLGTKGQPIAMSDSLCQINQLSNEPFA